MHCKPYRVPNKANITMNKINVNRTDVCSCRTTVHCCNVGRSQFCILISLPTNNTSSHTIGHKAIVIDLVSGNTQNSMAYNRLLIMVV